MSVYDDIDKKCAEKMKCSVEDLNNFIDKKIKVRKPNKLGQQLYLYRRVVSEHIVGSVYKNRAYYYIYNSSGDEVGFVEGTVENCNEANSVELEYAVGDNFKQQGNMSAAVDTVLEDVLLEGSLNGYPVRNGNFSKIDEVCLSITTNNKGSRGVARNNGFKVVSDSVERNNGIFVITKKEFEERQAYR